MTPPFQYPPTAHVRRHGPLGYVDYDSYRPWLRDEFSSRCVYCLRREQWGLVKGTFSIDHFIAVGIDPDRKTEYDNLLYACSTCNFAKGARVLPDPLTALTIGTIRVEEDGTIRAKDTSEAAQLVEVLELNSQDYVEFRKLWMDIIILAQQKNPDLYQRIMGYPSELPDLRMNRPPGGNNRPRGVEQSALALRLRGELPSTY